MLEVIDWNLEEDWNLSYSSERRELDLKLLDTIILVLVYDSGNDSTTSKVMQWGW